MTRVDTDQVHVSLNGEGAVVELNPGRLTNPADVSPHSTRVS